MLEAAKVPGSSAVELDERLPDTRRIRRREWSMTPLALHNARGPNILHLHLPFVHCSIPSTHNPLSICIVPPAVHVRIQSIQADSTGKNESPTQQAELNRYRHSRRPVVSRIVIAGHCVFPALQRPHRHGCALAALLSTCLQPTMTGSRPVMSCVRHCSKSIRL